jgi:hypothetical protein
MTRTVEREGDEFEEAILLIEAVTEAVHARLRFN